MAIPGDNRVGGKEIGKIEKYQELKREIKSLWLVRKIEVVPVVIGALGSVSKKFEQWMKKIGITVKVEQVQVTTLLETARILRRLLES